VAVDAAAVTARESRLGVVELHRAPAHRAAVLTFTGLVAGVVQLRHRSDYGEVERD
jgi:hypothetical protein